ncbi:MAG TPA: TonB family protein [Rhodothermales bacterium]|nr:TonB family protein [Rhodothermales bacterium]
MRRLAFVLALLAVAAPASAQRAAPVAEETGAICVVEQMPELIGGLASIRPVYPVSERRAGIEGRVFVQFVVGVDGSVSDITVTRGVTPALDAAAVEAVSHARFTPGMQRERPVQVRFSLPVNFRLNDDTPTAPAPPREAARGAEPPAYSLSAPVPNPARDHARVILTLDRGEEVAVAVYDALGRRVATLHDGPLTAGAHAFTLDAHALASGTYVVRATGSSFAATTRAVLAR